MGFPVQTGSNDGLVRQSRGSPSGIRKCQLPQLTQRLIRRAHQAPFCARGLLKNGAVSENAPGAHRNVPRFGGCSTRLRGVPHTAPRTGGCSTEMRHLAGGIASGASRITATPATPVTATAPTPPATSANSAAAETSATPAPPAPPATSDYSSEASSFIPSSIRDLSRNEKLSLIVLRWLPSG